MLHLKYWGSDLCSKVNYGVRIKGAQAPARYLAVDKIQIGDAPYACLVGLDEVAEGSKAELNDWIFYASLLP